MDPDDDNDNEEEEEEYSINDILLKMKELSKIKPPNPKLIQKKKKESLKNNEKKSVLLLPSNNNQRIPKSHFTKNNNQNIFFNKNRHQKRKRDNNYMNEAFNFDLENRKGKFDVKKNEEKKKRKKMIKNDRKKYMEKYSKREDEKRIKRRREISENENENEKGNIIKENSSSFFVVKDDVRNRNNNNNNNMNRNRNRGYNNNYNYYNNRNFGDEFVYVKKPKRELISPSVLFKDLVDELEGIKNENENNKMETNNNLEVGIFWDLEICRLQLYKRDLEMICCQLRNTGETFSDGIRVKKTYGDWRKHQNRNEDNLGFVFFNFGYDIKRTITYNSEEYESLIHDSIVMDVLKFSHQIRRNKKYGIVFLITNRNISPSTFHLMREIDNRVKVVLIFDYSKKEKMKRLIAASDYVCDWFRFTGYPEDILSLKVLKFEKRVLCKALIDYFCNYGVVKVEITEICKAIHLRYKKIHLSETIRGINMFHMDDTYLHYKKQRYFCN